MVIIALCNDYIMVVCTYRGLHSGICTCDYIPYYRFLRENNSKRNKSKHNARVTNVLSVITNLSYNIVTL